jgi:hypothetical protein
MRTTTPQRCKNGRAGLTGLQSRSEKAVGGRGPVIRSPLAQGRQERR